MLQTAPKGRVVGWEAAAHAATREWASEYGQPSRPTGQLVRARRGSAVCDRRRARSRTQHTLALYERRMASVFFVIALRYMYFGPNLRGSLVSRKVLLTFVTRGGSLLSGPQPHDHVL